MARIRIGELLIKQGLITETQLQEAINIQKRQKGSRIGEDIDPGGHDKGRRFCRYPGHAIIGAFRLLHVRPLKPKSEQNLERLVNYEFAKKNFVLPLSKNMHSLTCAVFDPLDFFVLDN